MLSNGCAPPPTGPRVSVVSWPGPRLGPTPSHPRLGSAPHSYLDGGTDEATSAMHFQHPLKELIPLGLVAGQVPIGQVNGFRNATCEIYECIRRVAAIQGLVTARQPGEQQARKSQFRLPGSSQSVAAYRSCVKLRNQANCYGLTASHSTGNSGVQVLTPRPALSICTPPL